MSVRKVKYTDMVFLILGLLLFLQIILPAPVFVSAAGNREDPSVSCSFSDEHSSKKVLFVTKRDRDRKIRLVTGESDYRIRIYCGLFRAGELSRNPQDGQYYSRIILDSFLEEETVSHPQYTYFKDMTVSQLFDEYKEQYMILFAVSGDSSEGWDETMETAFLECGFDKTPGQGGTVSAGYYYRSKALIRSGEGVIDMDVFAADQLVHLISEDAYHGNSASIMIGGEETSAGGNGLNIVVYDPENDILIDSVSFNTNTSDPVMSRAEELFECEYVSLFREGLSEYIVEAGRVSGHFIRLGSVFALTVLLLTWYGIKRVQSREKVRNIPALIFLMGFAAVRRGSLYLASSFKGISLEQLVFHLNTSLKGLNWKGFTLFFLKLAFDWLLAVFAWALFSFLAGWIKKRASRNGKEKRAEVIACILDSAFTVFAAGLLFAQTELFFRQYHVNDYLISRSFESDLYETEYVPPEETEILFPENKMNLIYIFLESAEISLADEENGGGKGYNAIPELTELALQNDCFRGEGDGLNGALPLYNTTWTIAGMTAQSSGLPLGINHYFTNTAGNIGQFMPGALTLGDILEKEGYRNVLMMGSDARFGNRDTYYREHGSYEILDYIYAKKTGVIPAGYKVFWGMEDSRLFDWAKEEAEELAGSGDPFNLQILTVDTHFPNGYKCAECPDVFPDQYSNAFACSSRQVDEFVSWVYEQPWGKDTVVVLCGDHLSMGTEYFDDMPDDYERKTYTAVINAQKEEPDRYRYYSTMDMFPTTLSAMGCIITGDRLAFGTDLYSETPTLLERRDRNDINYQLSLHSDYYQDVILYGKQEQDD